MTNNPVNWFEIYVKDTARAKAFYQGVSRRRWNDWTRRGPV
jgi:predicted enzyme related to lactoylglutathione lyase